MTANLLELPATAEAPSNRPDRQWSRALWLLVPLILVIVLAVYPLVRVLTSSFEGADQSSWAGVLSSELFRSSLLTTAQIAVLSTLGCLVLGTFIAVVLAFVPFP